jgi:hypothetical protein
VIIIDVNIFYCTRQLQCIQFSVIIDNIYNSDKSCFDITSDLSYHYIRQVMRELLLHNHYRFCLPLITRINIHHTSVIIVFYVFTFIHMGYLLIGDTMYLHLYALAQDQPFTSKQCSNIKMWQYFL